MTAGASFGHDGTSMNGSPTEEQALPASAPRTIAATLVTGIAVCVAGALLLEPLLAETAGPNFLDRFNLFRMGAALGFGVVGAWIIASCPQHRVGWLFGGVGLAMAVSMFSANYGLLGLHRPDLPLPAASWLAWVSGWIWTPAFWAVPTLALLWFPTGRFLSRRWRVVGVVAGAAIVTSTVGWAALPASESQISGAVPPGVEWPVASSVAVFEYLTGLGLLVGAVAVLSSLTSLVVRYRRAGTRERQQIKWVLVAAIVMTALQTLTIVTPPVADQLLLAAAAVLLPVSIGVAILQHGLWDIDLVFSRSLVFAILTALVLGAYGATALVLGAILGSHTGVPLVATALVAVGIQPAHRGVRRAVNRFVYGERDQPAETLRQLGEHLTAAGPVHDVLERAAQSMARALRVPHVAITASGQPVAAFGTATTANESVPLTHMGRHIGYLEIGIAPGDRLRRSDRQALEALTPHLALAVMASQLTDDLERSRRRLIAARTDERDLLRRELHDGVGPTLAALALEVDRGRLLLDSDPNELAHVLDTLSLRIRETVQVVRAVAENLRPPSLDELGLVGAIQHVAQGLHGKMRVKVVAPDELPPLDGDLELAAYRIAAEALTNAARHACASRCAVTLTANGALAVRIADDGCGLPTRPRRGVGLGSMHKRAEDVGGTLTISGEHGTTVLARLPLTRRR